jgi:putative NADPH-quinone reductase
VFAHPALNSSCRATLDAFVRGLHESGHECEVGDLYRVPFDPALGDLAFDRERRGDTEAPVPADVLAQQDCVRRSGALALVFSAVVERCAGNP